jgi:outer membrane protein OmpA-like peptidoglycan-associated protein
MTIRIVPIASLLGCMVLGLGASQVAAQKTTPSVSEITRGLEPVRGLPRLPSPLVPENPNVHKTRDNKSEIPPPPNPTALPCAGSARCISFNTIQFAFNSARLTPGSIGTLRNLAIALNQLVDQKAFMIEGHTDASGGMQHNIVLSRRRAEAVKDYLVREGHVAPSRLQTDGKGPKELANPANPYAPENRRVVVINLGT